MTEPLWRWSVNKKCRFVVRVFDNTAKDDKATYKHRMRVLEKKFYKYEVQTERFRP